jgi:hypothetical protein
MQPIKAPPSSRHRPVVEAIETEVGVLVREDYCGHPKGVSNVYLQSAGGAVVWDAELPSWDDTFTGPIQIRGRSFRCATWKGFSSEHSLESGKLIRSHFTK